MNSKLLKNKWFYAVVATAVIAIAAIVVAIVIGVTSSKTPEYTEGAEIGVYYYDVKDGEMLLTLSGGNKFTLTGPNTNKTGTYTVDGETITLDFIKDEDGTTTATIAGDKLTLTYDNATMPMLKKVNYTVTFNVNGGTEIAAVTVVNGKTVSKPADPAKENNVFLGWYADEALATPFNFDAVVVKADMTVYAKWAAKTAGVADYNVNFDLGYVGADAMAPIVTVSGKAYNVPTPVRDGYTFGGWWLSDSDDAAKLTYAYTDDLVFTADTTLYAVWYDNASAKLNAPAVSVTANSISWNYVDGATSYKLTVVAPDGTVLVDNKTVTANTENFDFAANAAGEYKVYVSAVANDETKNSDAAARYYNNKTLDRVTGFQVVNGWLVFGTVANAEKYIVTVDCGNDAHVHNAFDNGKSTVFNIANCQMQKGGILVAVTAVAEGYASSTSKLFVYDLTLDKVGYIAYQPENDAVVWTAVENAAAYIVTVTVGEKTYTFNTGSETKFSTAGFSGDFTVAVVAATEGYNSSEAVSVACKKTAPAAPEAIKVNGMTISWNAVEGAVSYEVKIGDQTAVATTNSINLTDATAITLNQGQYYTVSVKAVNAAGEASSYSKATNIGYFALNPALKYENNTVSWTPVLGVTTYWVKVNGIKVATVENANSLKVQLTKEGENVIEVCYIHADVESNWATLVVNAFAVQYDSRTDTNGVIGEEYLAVGDTMALPVPEFDYPGYEFAGWYNTPMGAEGNGKVYADGATFNGNAYTVVYANWIPKTYEVTLNTTGFAINNITDGQKEAVKYDRYYTLPVPEMTDTGMYFFAGWYTGPSGTGTQLTDEDGRSVKKYPFKAGVTAYPYYSTDALEFVLQADGTYGVKKGPTINNISNLKIPATYNEIAVTVVLESAFSTCNNLITVSIPDTIKLVGVNAFQSAKALKEINIYEARPGEVYEKIYSSENGVLIREDMGTTYLEIAPRALTGHYTIPANVDMILSKAFYYTEIESLTIPDTITTIPKYAFYYCQSLKSVEFTTGRLNPLVMENYAFYQCSAVESLALPANIDMEAASLKSVLDQFTGLKSLTIEEGGVAFATQGGMLTDKDGNIIYYCPKAYAGDITIPKGVTTIYEKAFYNCKQITSLTVPNYVTSIGSQAFYGCAAMETVTFAGSRVENLEIGSSAFAYNKIKTITFEGNGNFVDEGSNELDTGAVTIGTSAFTVSSGVGYSFLTKVEIQAGVKIATIGQSAFANNEALVDFIVDENAYVGEIGKMAFKGCIKFISFTIPKTVTSIGENAFQDCTKLATINFQEGGTSLAIANNAFQNCEKLASVTLPKHLTSFNSSAFEGCDSLKHIIVIDNPVYKNDENNVLYKYKTEGEDDNQVDVLTELIFYPKGLAKDKNGIINDLPSTIVTIGDGAFSNNKYLIEVTLPKSVTTIGKTAFANCVNLKKVHFTEPAQGETLELTIGDAAFFECKSLADDFALPSYTTKIGMSAFKSCGFTRFVIPAKVAEIGAGAFAFCKDLETVIFNCDGALVIADGNSYSTTASATTKHGAFAFCESLETVTFPKGLTAIGNYTFYECASLRTVNFTPEITTVGEGSEQQTVSTYKLTKIGTYAFRYCYAFEEIYIPNSVETLGNYAFQMKSGTTGALHTVTFGLGGTAKLEVGTQVFEYNPNLTSITFPARVTKIAGKAAITTSNVGTSQLPFYKVFTGCTGLAEVNVAVEDGITSAAYTTLDGVLYNADKTVLIYCPIANVGKYNGETPTYEIIVPNTVKVVINNAFYNNSQLKTVTFKEFDDKGQENAKYGSQLLTLGNYNKTGTSSWSSYTTYAVIGGETSSITTINLPSHLSTIKAGAFAVKTGEAAIAITFNQDASNITLERNAFGYSLAGSLDIPGVKSMGVYLFESCLFLQSVSIDIPTTTTAIPDYMFYKAAALTTYEIPANIKTLGKYSFYGTAFTSVTIPATVTTLGTNVFQACKSLVTVTFAEGSTITKLPASAFQECEVLENINIEDLALTEIGNQAFYKCYVLSDVDFTKFTELKTMGTLAFRQTALVDVDLSKTQLTKLDTTFRAVSTLKTIILPETLTQIVAYAFSDDTALTKVTLLGKNLEVGSIPNIAVISSHAEIVLPETMTNFVLDEYGVAYDTAYQNLYSAAFAQGVLEYQIPSTVTNISASAFQYVKMNKLEIPETVTLIGAKAFQYAEIPYIVFPSGIETISASMFEYSKLEKIEFRNEHQSQLKKIENFAFRECDNLVEFSMPDSVTEIGYSLFLRCDNLKKVVFAASLKKACTEGSGGSIMCSILLECSSLEEVIFQEGLEEIGPLFASVGVVGDQGISNNVKTLVLPSTVKTLHRGAFAYFTNLETLTIAEGSQLETIDEQAFLRCYSLQGITLPATTTTLGINAFEHCRSLQTADLSASAITVIPEYAFTQATNLSNLKLPHGVVTIEKYAFYKTGIVELEIPATLKTIGVSAFERCTNLETITFHPDNTMEELGDDTNNSLFRYAESLETVVLPNHLKSIGPAVFANTGVKYVKMGDEEAPSQLENVSAFAFYECRNLVEFDHFEAVTSIGDYAFFNCDIQGMTAESLKKDLDGLVEFGTMALGFNTNLPVGYIPNSVVSISGNPYAGLDKSKIELEEGNLVVELNTDDNGVVTLIDLDGVTIYGIYGATGAYDMQTSFYVYTEGALGGNGITSVVISEDMETIPDALFMNCEALSNVTIEDGITAIGAYAFSGTGIASIGIPSTVTAIGDYAFSDCDSLNNVFIPNSVTILGPYCFAYCDTLSEFEFEESTEWQELGDHFFYNCPSITEVIVPSKPKISTAEAQLHDNGSYNTKVLPGYMFAGTGIVNAYIPSSVSYFYTDGLFQNCKQLEKVTFEFDQSTSSSSIYDNYNSNTFVGCDNFQYVAYVEQITSGYFYLAEYIHNWGIYDIHVQKSIKTDGTAALPNYPRFEYSPAKTTLYFDADTYVDLIEYFQNVQRDWVCSIYDKDGNQLFCNGTTGAIDHVKDKDGNVIWSVTATE